MEPPIEPMLAKLVDSIPTTNGLLFEPKWDGFRSIVFRSLRSGLVGPESENSRFSAAEAMAESIVRAVSAAGTLNGVPSARELGTVPARIK